MTTEIQFDSRNDTRESMLQYYRASVNIAEGATLTVRDELLFRGGFLNGKLSGPPEIVKTTRASGRIAGLSETFDGPITIHGGVLTVSDDTGLGSNVGVTTGR